MSLKVMSKPVFRHFCVETGQTEKMPWKPHDMLSFQVPQVSAQIRPFLPCVAGFCQKCGELWVLPVKAAA